MGGFLPLWKFVRPSVIVKLFAPDLATGFDKGDFGSSFALLFGQDPACRPRTNYTNAKKRQKRQSCIANSCAPACRQRIVSGPMFELLAFNRGAFFRPQKPVFRHRLQGRVDVGGVNVVPVVNGEAVPFVSPDDLPELHQCPLR
jgi:hypothetical protein